MKNATHFQIHAREEEKTVEYMRRGRYRYVEQATTQADVLIRNGFVAYITAEDVDGNILYVMPMATYPEHTKTAPQFMDEILDDFFARMDWSS